MNFVIAHADKRPLRMVITQRCNARCRCCHHEGFLSPAADLDADQLRREVTQGFFGQFARVAITGGEPTLHSRIYDIVEHVASSTAVPIAINTNGLVESRRFAKLLRLRIAEVHISIHSLLPEVNARVFGVPYDANSVVDNVGTVIENGVGLCINRMVLAGVNSEPMEVVDFAERWGGEIAARVQLFPDLYETDTAKDHIFASILAEAHRRGYRCRHWGRHRVFQHTTRASFTWTSSCTPEAMNPPDFAAAAVFMTPRLTLKRMLSPEEWPWRPDFNNALPTLLGPSGPATASLEARRRATVETGL